MKNFKAEGNVLTATAGADYDSGDGVVIGDRAGVVCHDVVSGNEMEVMIEGVVELAKTNVAMNIGEKLYWDAADGNVQKTADSGTNKPMGWAAETAASGVTVINVKLGAY